MGVLYIGEIEPEKALDLGMQNEAQSKDKLWKINEKKACYMVISIC